LFFWQPVAKGVNQAAKGGGPVGESVLLVQVDFGHGLAELGQEEQRVVAEAALASGGVEQNTLARTGPHLLGPGLRVDERGGAPVARMSIVRGDGRHLP
jgi:hypothetical protein